MKAQLTEVKNSSKLLELTRKRNDYKQQIYTLSYDKISNTKGKTDLYDKYITVKARFNTKKSLLKDKRLKAKRDKYFETVNTKEINNQLNGIIPQKTFILSALVYKLIDRATAVQLFFEPIDNFKASKVFQIQIILINCLIRLCHLRESPCPYQARNSAVTLELENTQIVLGIIPLVVIDEPDTLQMPEEGLICGFCRQDKKPIGLKK